MINNKTFKYDVEIKETSIYIIDVEADDEYKAIEIAYTLLEDKNNRVKYLDDSDSDADILTKYYK